MKVFHLLIPVNDELIFIGLDDMVQTVLFSLTILY